jgi:hypothetical protein
MSSDKMREALAEYDAVVAACPANKTHLGDNPCPKCKAERTEGCRSESRAAFAFIQQARQALASTAQTASAGERETVRLEQRRLVNTILAKLVAKDNSDLIDRIKNGNEACTAILAALQTPNAPDATPVTSTVDAAPREAHSASHPIVRANLFAPDATEVRSGWKLVPVEPTEAMLGAPCLPDGASLRRAIWSAMLSAAPSPPTDAEVSEAEVERLREYHAAVEELVLPWADSDVPAHFYPNGEFDCDDHAERVRWRRFVEARAAITAMRKGEG